MRFNRLTWYGIVIAVFWVLNWISIYEVYKGTRFTTQHNPCYGPPPLPYPNRILTQEFPFATYDSTAEILEFYRQTGPLPPPNAPTLARQDGNHSIYEFPTLLPLVEEGPYQSCGESLKVSIVEYGFFRIVTLYYGQLTVDMMMR